MRSLVLVLVIALGACKPADDQPQLDTPDAAPVTVDEVGLKPPDHGFQIVSPTIEIKPGAEVTYCYYFHTPNTVDMSIKQWASHMTPGSHHLILYLTPTDQQTAGTLSTSQCGISNGTTGPVWTYSAQLPDTDAKLPADDGTGTPVGQVIKAGQSGFLQMHYLNASDTTLRVHVALNAYAYPEGTRITPAAPFVTFNRQILLMPGSPAVPYRSMVSGTCTVPVDGAAPPKFYVMTTHTHKQGVHTFVKDGATTLFDSTSWEHPGTATWDRTPFYTFTSGALTYQCEYANPNGYTIQTGDSAKDEEMCMAIGYYFPAVAGTGHYCLNSALVY